MSARLRISFLTLAAAQSRILVGGQAVIEGVMMRVPGAYAVAVRQPDGEIRLRRERFTSLVESSRWLKLPVVRGMIHLFESLKLGISTLNWSAEVAYPDDDAPSGWSTVLSTSIALLLGVGLFFVAPLWLTTRLLQVDQQAVGFNLVSGGIRITFFLVYLGLISLLKDVRRLFEYHGAEHKVVYTFEAGRPLTVDNTRDFSTRHPRCGTSFLFIVLIAAILAFALIDTIALAVVGRLTLGLRLLVHLPLIPLVAGIGYEALKLTARYQHLWLPRWLSRPGLWLQGITTREPDEQQLAVALEALKEAFGEDLPRMEGRQYVAEAIA